MESLPNLKPPQTNMYNTPDYRFNKDKAENSFIGKRRKPVVKPSLKITDKSFPKLSNDTPQSNEVVKNVQQYNIKQLFRKTKKKKIKQIDHGWVRLYFKKNVICREYGKPLTPSYDPTEYFQSLEIEKLLNRHQDYEEHDELNFYVPSWVSESIYTDSDLDNYPSDNDTDDEEWSDDDEHYDDDYD